MVRATPGPVAVDSVVLALDRFVAADMRLALPKDVNKESIVPLDPLEVYPSELD